MKIRSLSLSLFRTGGLAAAAASTVMPPRRHAGAPSPRLHRRLEPPPDAACSLHPLLPCPPFPSPPPSSYPSPPSTAAARRLDLGSARVLLAGDKSDHRSLYHNLFIPRHVARYKYKNTNEQFVDIDCPRTISRYLKVK
jgi:hypothetical protein